MASLNQPHLCLFQTAHGKSHPLELLLALDSRAADSAQNMFFSIRKNRGGSASHAATSSSLQHF